MNWLDKIPLLPLLIIALLLAILPYPREPMPHLLEKLGMLSQGALTKPIDIFDLFLHGTPLALLILKVIRTLRNKKPA